MSAVETPAQPTIQHEEFSSPLPPLSPATIHRLDVYDDPEFISVSEYTFYSVLYNLVRIASSQRGIESYMYDVLDHILHAFCFSATTGFSCTSQPKFFSGLHWKSPDFAVYRHFVDRTRLVFTWEAKSLDLKKGEWISPQAASAAQQSFFATVPQLFKQALLVLHHHPDVNVFYVFFSAGLYFTLLTFNRPDGDATEPLPDIPKATKRQKRDYGPVIKKLQEDLGHALRTRLRPDMVYYSECMVDDNWRIHPRFAKALVTAGLLGNDATADFQKSWMKFPKDDPLSAPSPMSLNSGVMQLNAADQLIISSIQEPLLEILGENDWTDVAASADASDGGAYKTSVAVDALHRRALPPRAARPKDLYISSSDNVEEEPDSEQPIGLYIGPLGPPPLQTPDEGPVPPAPKSSAAQPPRVGPTVANTLSYSSPPVMAPPPLFYAPPRPIGQAGFRAPHSPLPPSSPDHNIVISPLDPRLELSSSHAQSSPTPGARAHVVGRAPTTRRALNLNVESSWAPVMRGWQAGPENEVQAGPSTQAGSLASGLAIQAGSSAQAAQTGTSTPARTQGGHSAGDKRRFGSRDST